MQKRNSLVTLAAAALIVLILVLISQVGFMRPVSSFFGRFFSPLARAAYLAGNLFRVDTIDGLSASDLKAKLSEIENENRRLIGENIRLTEMEQENNTLRQHLNFFADKNLEHITASVTSRGRAEDSWQQHDSLILNRGTRDGLSVGLPIVDGQGALLGKLTKVEERSSEACLLLDNDCRVAVSLQGTPGTAGVIQSDLNLTIKADFIPQNVKVSENQIVISSGLEEGMLSGLLVGKVSRVVSEGNELWQHAIISPLANFDDLRLVSIIK